MDDLLSRYEAQHDYMSAQPGGWGSGRGGASPPQQAWQDPAQRAQQQAQRLYQQQLMQQQQQQYRSQQPAAIHGDYNAFQGYGNSLDPFAWDKQVPSNSFAQFNDLHANPTHGAQPSMLARQALGVRQVAHEPGRDNVAPASSMPTSSGTPRSNGPRGGQSGVGSKGKSKQKKSPAGESSVMQRCLEVIEQLLEEEDAEPFAEPTRLENSKSSSNDMCDNMEKFFYQAWKGEGLPLPPGAGPALSRGRSGRGQTSTSGRHQEVDQHNTKHDKRKHAHRYEDNALSIAGNPAHMSNKSSLFQNKQQRGSGIIAPSQDQPGSSKKRGRAEFGSPKPLPPPVQYQESEKEKEAERKDQEAVKAWEKLQQQQRKAQQLIQAAQEAVHRMHEARAALEGVQKSAAEAEAAQAAAEALRPWPSDARLVPSDYPLYPPSTPQRLHPDIATVGSYMFSLSSPSATEGQSSFAADSNIAADTNQAKRFDAQPQDANAGEARRLETISDRDVGTVKQGGCNDDQRDDTREALLQNASGDDVDLTKEEGPGSSSKQDDAVEEAESGNVDAVDDRSMTGWQRRLQTGWSEEQLQQIIQAGRLGHTNIPTVCSIIL